MKKVLLFAILATLAFTNVHARNQGKATNVSFDNCLNLGVNLPDGSVLGDYRMTGVAIWCPKPEGTVVYNCGNNCITTPTGSLNPVCSKLIAVEDEKIIKEFSMYNVGCFENKSAACCTKFKTYKSKPVE